MLNKQQELPYLEEFCKKMFDEHQVRFQPHNPPVDLILDKLLCDMKKMEAAMGNLAHLINGLYAIQASKEEVVETPKASTKKTKKKGGESEQ